MKVAVQLRQLNHSYGKAQALVGVDLEVNQGEIFGLVGPDGAGKTTLIKIVVGLIPPCSGEMHVERGPGFGYIPQRFSLYRDLSVEENIDFFATIYGVKDYQERKRKLLLAVGLEEFRGRLASQLSGGMKQKLSLCCALIHNPTTLVMDEPTTGVDPVSRREFWSVIFQLQKQGLTVLASTPYMDEAEQFDRVALINRGRVLRMGTTAQIKDSVPGQVLQVLCGNPYRARELLRPVPGIRDVELFGDSIHVFVDQGREEMSQQIASVISGGGLKVEDIKLVPYSIEDIFLRLAV